VNGPYSLDVKAAALAALATGESLHSVARRLGISRATLRRWRGSAAPLVAQGDPQKTQQIGAQLCGFLEESIETLTTQARVVRDDAWLRRQSAADLAVLHGVMFDKTARLLAAFEPIEGG
jgi:transposase-like protein